MNDYFRAYARKMLCLLWLIPGYSLWNPATAQDTQQQSVGLCLSGGGARGLAHIALLKAIDSLGIEIDYIAGTSMGGVLGGLYSIGYSGQQLDSLARNTDWTRLFEVKTPYNEIFPDEKDEYGRYIIEMPWRVNKFELPSGLIEGQSLLNKLEALTTHVAHISDFNQFPIPFRCTAANISDGQFMVLDRGSLALALRATMSIPGVFAPIVMGDSKLLVDGGVFKVFPVDVLCDMGADFVIGGYTSISLIPEEELHSLTKIVVQSTSFNRIADSDQQRLSCSIYADFAEELNATKLTASDFRSVNAILDAGERAVQKIMPELAALAIAQNKAKEEALECKPHIKAPARVSGEPLPPLKIYSSNNARMAFKAGLHYDNEMDAGLIGNFTLRDVFGQRSRTIVSTEIAENWKMRAEHRVSMGKTNNNFVTRVYFERVKAPVYFDALSFENFRRRFFRVQTGVQRNMGKNAITGAFITYEQVGYVPDIRVSKRRLGQDTLTGTVKASAKLPGLDFIFLRQNFDQLVLPTEGGHFSVQARLNIATRVRFVSETVIDGSVIRRIDNNHLVQPYPKVLVKWERLYPLNSYVSLFPHLYAGARLTSRAQEKQLNVLDRFYTGGADWRNDWAFVPFAGNREGYTNHSAFAAFQMAVPLHFQKKFFIIPQYTLLSGTGLNNTETPPILGINNALQQSIGVTLGLQTLLGPVWLNIAKADNDPSVRLYGSIGMRF